GDCRSTIRGGGNRLLTWHHADGENGPAARSFAADAHDCIMVRIQTDLPHTSLAARNCAPMASSPRINTPDKRCPTPQLTKPVSQSSSLRVLRRQGAAKTQATLSGKPLSCASVSVP